MRDIQLLSLPNMASLPGQPAASHVGRFVAMWNSKSEHIYRRTSYIGFHYLKQSNYLFIYVSGLA